MAEQMLPPSIAPLRNVSALMSMVDRIQNRDYSLPGMGVYHGPSGWGKTSAVTVCANEFNAHSIQVKEGWTASHFCEIILTEMGVKPRGTFSRNLDQVGMELMRSGRPLLIDDAQYLNTNRKIGTVRDIYESSQSTIILVGEEDLPHKLTKWENVHNRMLSQVAAQPCDLADAEHLTQIYARGVSVAKPLLRAIVGASGGSIRRVAVNLSHVREMAQVSGLNIVGIDDWGDRDFYTGTPPASRAPIVPIRRTSRDHVAPSETQNRRAVR